MRRSIGSVHGSRHSASGHAVCHSQRVNKKVLAGGTSAEEESRVGGFCGGECT